MKNRKIVAMVVLALMIPGAQAGAEGIGATTAIHEVAAQPQSSPEPLLEREEFIAALGMEPPLGDTEERVLDGLHGFYMSVSELMRSVREARTADIQAPVAELNELKLEAEKLDEEIDAFEDTLRATYRAGGITRDQYRFFSAELEYMDDGLDIADDVLEALRDGDWDDILEGRDDWEWLGVNDRVNLDDDDDLYDWDDDRYDDDDDDDDDDDYDDDDDDRDDD